MTGKHSFAGYHKYCDIENTCIIMFRTKGPHVTTPITLVVHSKMLFEYFSFIPCRGQARNLCDGEVMFVCVCGTWLVN